MNMQERAESITNVRGKGTHCHVNDLLGWRSWKRMDFKTLFFSKFWNESFYGIFFPWHPCLLFSSHSDIINNYVTKRQSHFFVVPVSVFLFFFVLFCTFLFFFWSPCSFWWHFLIFFFNLKHSRIYMSWKVNVTLWKETTTTTTNWYSSISLFFNVFTSHK